MLSPPPLAGDPRRLSFGKSQPARDRRAARNREPKRIRLDHAQHVSPRRAMTRDHDVHDLAVEHQLMLTGPRRGRAPRTFDGQWERQLHARHFATATFVRSPPYHSSGMFRSCCTAIAALTVAATLGAAPPLTVRDLDGRAWTPLQPPAGEVDFLVFITTDCPISNRYAPEIARIAADYAPRGVRTLLVFAEASLDASRARAHLTSFFPSLPAVIDKDFALTASVGATVTPLAAIYTSSGRAYRGRIDDLYVSIGQARREPTRRDVRLSLDAVIAGRPAPLTETTAFGCFIERIKK
jgi:hypothetical protein